MMIEVSGNFIRLFNYIALVWSNVENYYSANKSYLPLEVEISTKIKLTSM